MKPSFRLAAASLALLASVSLTGYVSAQTAESALPHLVSKDGRHALIVDGAPFLILGAQSNNSSAWPATLPKVWAALALAQANTLEVPVYWEQFEPEQGKFDHSIVDVLLTQAREHKVRLVLLWFGTWKNGSSHYLPMWLKRQRSCARASSAKAAGGSTRRRPTRRPCSRLTPGPLARSCATSRRPTPSTP